MVNIIHRTAIKAPISRVYGALSTIQGLAGWWTEETAGTSKTGGTIEFTFRSNGEVLAVVGMEVAALDENKHVRWRCKSGIEEWVGTDITFDLAQDGDYTVV